MPMPGAQTKCPAKFAGHDAGKIRCGKKPEHDPEKWGPVSRLREALAPVVVVA